ncbi:Pantothenate kinase [Colletotrichum gloeosporioides]|uniref:Pantothenate kinase n=1 Tax=Colletotrichum gloeosporioides TaxID=474922 RepID=A0A8H4C5E0_COLGL|nr:Pantothenate kinase [Colletotrichum gloeosporioides]KAF3797438.1 Pantothenate kinase [Colletotrichum gloeosporioides]
MCPAPDHGTSAIEDPRPDDHHNDDPPATDTEPAIHPGADVRTRARTMTSTEEIDNTIIRPGSVRINVKGAFIVDPDSSSPRSNGRGSPTHHETSDIRLPNHHAVVSHIAVDIGGSLIKLVYFTREAGSKEPGGRLNFLNFETDRIDDCIEFMRHLKDKQQTLNGSQPNALSVMATGGGAFKFYDKMRDVLGVDVLREEEMECLIIGLDFFITEIPREVFTYSETDPMHFVSPSENIYPYLLVNIGSGVSMLKVSGPNEYQRVGGTSLGGGTLWGLLSLLTGARTFDEMLDASEQGDNAKVDMLVGDIYGGDYGKIGLKSTTIASSFGKVFRMKRTAETEAEDHGGLHNGDNKNRGSPSTQPEEGSTEESHHAAGENASDQPFSSADVSRSLLYAISNNIGQIAFLQSQIHNLDHIYFGGSFIRGHRQTINTLSYAIKFWSQGKKQAYFLRHEGYLGSVGAFLKRQPRNWGRRGSFEEAQHLERRLRGRVALHDPEMQSLVDDYASESGRD